MFADHTTFRLLHEDWVTDAGAERRGRRRPFRRVRRGSRDVRR
jgi:hypothetical protein